MLEILEEFNQNQEDSCYENKYHYFGNKNLSDL